MKEPAWPRAEFGLDWRTAKRYATAQEAPRYRPRARPAELSAAQLAHLERRLAACADAPLGTLMATDTWREAIRCPRHHFSDVVDRTMIHDLEAAATGT